MRSLVTTATAVAAGAIGCFAIAGTGFAEYDSAYALIWGDQLSRGELPDYAAAFAPTPKPLAALVGLVLSPLGDGAETALVALAFIALGWLGWLVYALGAHWFGRAVGLVAAAIILTRQPILSFGARTYADIPYLDLLLAALLIEARRPRAGVPVLVLLALAGLLRPEAWLFAAIYLAYLRPRFRERRGLALAALTAAGPALWLGADALVTGDPLFSLLGTRENAAQLARPTGLDAVVSLTPRRLGEILREPVLLALVGGLALAVAEWRTRLRLPFAALAASLAAFGLLGVTGLPVLGRYLLFAAALLAIFAAAGIVGWLNARSPRARGAGAAFGVLATAAMLAYLPAQVDRLSVLRDDLAFQRSVRASLHSLADGALRERACDPLSVSTHRTIPPLALWLREDPSSFRDNQVDAPARRGYFVAAATREVEQRFLIDPRDRRRRAAPVPAGFRRVVGNAHWSVYARCGA